ncbi:MAG: type IV pilin protein [Gammaproteobacteria bacterium]|nr:MAG: type IV pilin protein [Gammaproteobacteria bacterium]
MHGFTRGFTLIELLVTVVVFAVIMAIALPVYQGQVREARRADARALLLDAANRERRFFADNDAFTATMTDLGFPNPAVSEQGNYLLSAVTVGNTFTVTATAQGPQLADTACATLSLASTGAKSATGGGDCW